MLTATTQLETLVTVIEDGTAVVCVVETPTNDDFYSRVGSAIVKDMKEATKVALDQRCLEADIKDLEAMSNEEIMWVDPQHFEGMHSVAINAMQVIRIKLQKQRSLDALYQIMG